MFGRLEGGLKENNVLFERFWAIGRFCISIIPIVVPIVDVLGVLSTKMSVLDET